MFRTTNSIGNGYTILFSRLGVEDGCREYVRAHTTTLIGKHRGFT